MNFPTLLLLLLSLFSCANETPNVPKAEAPFLSYEVNPKEDNLKLFWKDDSGNKIKTFASLKSHLKANRKKLLFAMNGGMYLKNHSPQGLYIEKGTVLKKIDTIQKAYGNFYMQPNGVFYIDKSKKAHVTQTKGFKLDSNIEYATQSGPMLLIDSQMHSKFIYQSKNLNIRNAVGILPNGNVLFAMSKKEVNFYDFAQFFLSKGCKHALYLDGFVSRCYLPEQDWEQMEGEFGVLIGVCEDL